MTGRPSRTASDAMVTQPWTHGSATTVAQAHEAFTDSHVHMLLLTDGDELRGTLVRDDLVDGLDPDAPALDAATLHARTVDPGRDLEEALQVMRDRGTRRLAVVADDGRLLGLLCLKRTLDGFCSDDDVRSRALEHGRLHRLGR
ncbi:CBS domain-containing protein [Nocardioides sediminis]|uniref:CBS domain-containing protein n=1 Tax=Nocardioides sediminis TaxID=433648 RepID=UPI000D2FD61B|nr:CBS domain-containing protein [Nocardioides sediminis]